MFYPYKVVTDRIIKCLENGVVPWKQPWVSGEPACNFITKHAYTGINRIITNMLGFNSPYFLTFKQVSKLGGHVKKGERAVPILFFSIKEEEVEAGTDKKVIVRYSNVFNIQQTTLDVPELDTTKVHDFTPIERAENIVSGFFNPPSIIHNRQQAYYLPSVDTVNMPSKNFFESAEHYYGVLFHELAHSTGNQSRLNRMGITEPIRFASHQYSFEELVAEISSSFLMHTAGLDLVEHNASYVGSWLKTLKDDPRQVIKAASEAEKAANFILGTRSSLEAANKANMPLASLNQGLTLGG